MAEGADRLNQHVLRNDRSGHSDHLGQGNLCLGFDASVPVGPEPVDPRLAGLLRAVETEIIPRLVLRQRPSPKERLAELPPDRAEVLRFASTLLAHGDAAAAPAFLAAFIAQGHSIEYVFLDLFQPAARHIGELWADDLCSFIDVTLALGTLQRMLRELSPDFQKEAGRFDAGRQALLVPMPGDQHTLGLTMVTEFFRRASWSVWSAPFRSTGELSEALQATSFTVVGFSVSCVDQLDRLKSVIEVVRRESSNRAVGVLVGGPVFVGHPEYVGQIGADVVGNDARHAVFEAECFATQMAGL